MLIDFGLCKKSKEGTCETKGVGTESYIAPEIFIQNEETYGAKSDVFSLGMTILCAAFGKIDFDARTTNAKRNEFGGFFSDFRSLEHKLKRLEVKSEMIDLITGMVTTDPKLRLSCRDVYDHPALKDEPDILQEVGHTQQAHVQEEAQDDAQDEVADLQEQLADEKTRADNAEKELAEAKRTIETLQLQVDSASDETGLEGAFSELNLSAGNAAMFSMVKFILESPTPGGLDRKAFLNFDDFLGDVENRGGLLVFGELFHTRWEDQMTAFVPLSKFLARYARNLGNVSNLLHKNSAEGKKYRGIEPGYERRSLSKEAEANRKQEWKSQAQQVATSISAQLEKAGIENIKDFFTAVDTIKLVVKAVFKDSTGFDVAIAGCDYNFAVVLAAIHVGASAEYKAYCLAQQH